MLENTREQLNDILAGYPDKRSALLPLLFAAQDEEQYLSEEVIDEVAEMLELDPTEVSAVAGFYHLFYKEPVGRYILRVCDDLPCSLQGADALVEHLQECLGIEPGMTTEDGLFTLERTRWCQGACDRAPVILVGLEDHARMTVKKVDQLLDDLSSANAGVSEDA